MATIRFTAAVEQDTRERFINPIDFWSWIDTILPRSICVTAVHHGTTFEAEWDSDPKEIRSSEEAASWLCECLPKEIELVEIMGGSEYDSEDRWEREARIAEAKAELKYDN